MCAAGEKATHNLAQKGRFSLTPYPFPLRLCLAQSLRPQSCYLRHITKCRVSPCREKKCLKAHIKELVSIFSRSSIWVALIAIAHENKFPALCICYSSSSLPSLHHPRSKDIKAYIVEGGSNFCSVYRKVCHLLFNMGPRSFLHVRHKPTRLVSATWLPQGSLDDLESLMVHIFMIILW